MRLNSATRVHTTTENTDARIRAPLQTLRSLSLGKQGLLPARLGAAFLWHRGIRLPVILAVATGTCVLCTGLLVWAATGSSAVFKVSVCLPTIVLLGRSTYRQDIYLGVWSLELSIHTHKQTHANFMRTSHTTFYAADGCGGCVVMLLYFAATPTRFCTSVYVFITTTSRYSLEVSVCVYYCAGLGTDRSIGVQARPVPPPLPNKTSHLYY